MRKIIFFFFCVLLLIIGVQQTALVKKWIAARIATQLQQELQCSCQIEIQDCNLLTSALQVGNLTLIGKNSLWRLESHNLTIKWSWFWLLYHKKLSIRLFCPTMSIQSDCHQAVPYLVQDIAESIARNPETAVFLRQIQLPNISIAVHDPVYGELTTQVALSLAQHWQSYKLQLQATNTLFTTITRSVHIPTIEVHGELRQQPNFMLHAHLTAQPFVPAPLEFICTRQESNVYAVTAHCHNSHAEGILHTTPGNYHFTGTLASNLEELAALANQQIPAISCNIMATVDATYTESFQCEGTLYATYKQFTTKVPFIVQDNYAKGRIEVSHNATSWASGKWHYPWQQQKLELTVHCLQELLVPLQRYWRIPAHQLQLSSTMQLGPTPHVEVEIKGLVAHAKARTEHLGGLQINYRQGELQAQGKLGIYTLKAAIPHPREGTVHITKNKQEEIAGVVWQPDANDEVSLHAWTEVGLVRAIINDAWADYLNGKGIIQVHANQRNQEVHMTGAFGEGSIFLGNTYNMINKATWNATYDWHTRLFTLQQGTIDLHKGSMSTQQGTLQLSPSWTIEHAHFPLTIHHSLMSWKKVYGLLSGKLLFLKKDAKPWHLRGNITIHKGQITNNVLSPEFQQTFATLQLLQHPEQQGMSYDVTVTSKKPITVKTPYITTESTVKLHVTGTSTAPTCQGEIQLHGGTITFPYKALTLDSGSVQFTKEHTLDPLLSLQAHGTIKRYQVTLAITGTTSKPQLHLQSVPTLSQAQLGALLLVGSPEAALNTMAPALLVDNLKQFILGSLEQSNTAQQKLSALLKPLKHIKIMPQLQDNAGKQSLLGGIDIELSDRLHASVQKDLTSQSSASIDVDYEVLDDVSVHAIKDERGDLGAELEMKWKF